MSPLSFGVGKFKPSPVEALPLSYGRYFVFQYYFTDGTDLDQRTSIITPSISGSVGFGSSTSIEPYLYWGGDNTGAGTETVYFDKTAILNDHPGTNIIEIDCRSWWYGAQGTDPVNIIVSSYFGGSMIVNNYQWENPTAQYSFVGFTSSPGKIISRIYADPSGPERVAKFTFNFLSNTVSVITT
jgi:hypothetical protein